MGIKSDDASEWHYPTMSMSVARNSKHAVRDDSQEKVTSWQMLIDHIGAFDESEYLKQQMYLNESNFALSQKTEIFFKYFPWFHV